MWSYFGSKTSIVKYYPIPIKDKIIEPFAGTAKYALRYWRKKVLIVDRNEIVIQIWKWLQRCSQSDIQKLPHFLKTGESLDNYKFDCVEAKLLMGFLVSKGLEKPRKTVSSWVGSDRPNFINFSLKRIAASLGKIRHWEIRQGCYSEIQNQEATWFIDPPYEVGGHVYPCGNDFLDYRDLSNWCSKRDGQVIVCEKVGADWLDFYPLTQHKGRNGIQSEAIWTNLKTSYAANQLRLRI